MHLELENWLQKLSLSPSLCLLSNENRRRQEDDGQGKLAPAELKCAAVLAALRGGGRGPGLPPVSSPSGGAPKG